MAEAAGMVTAAGTTEKFPAIVAAGWQTAAIVQEQNGPSRVAGCRKPQACIAEVSTGEFNSISESNEVTALRQFIFAWGEHLIADAPLPGYK
jgi:hypothetical protein